MNLFLPTNKEDLKQRGWKSCDIILISGDAYIDHPSFGAALIGKYLESLGYKVGIIAQPDWKTDNDFLQLGTPNLFVGITAGNIDSMLAHYTASKKKRSDDSYTPGNKHGKRPNRATIVYTNKVKQLMPDVPVAIGGIEASLRRIAHYDYWSDSIRKSIILDSKADILVYGMAETALKEIAEKLSTNKSIDNIRGTVVAKGQKSFFWSDYSNFEVLPSFEEIIEDKHKFLEMTRITENNMNPYNAKTLIQQHNNQYIVVNPPALPLTTEELDRIYSLKFANKPHYSYKEEIPAFEMIKDSVTILRGCPGGCSFCSLGLHQGKFVQSRSKKSIIKELKNLANRDYFKGNVSDIGGPSANVYAMGGKDKNICKKCNRPSCLYPQMCKNFNSSVATLIDLMSEARHIEKIKKVCISSGIRLDVAVKNPEYISVLAKHHVPGHLKVAPEHLDDSILHLMRKPPFKVFEDFSRKFYSESKKNKKNQYLLPYLIASFPGCTIEQMNNIAEYLRKNKIKVEQVQDFIPLPMTVAAAMYYTELNYFTGKKLYVAKNKRDRDAQRKKLFWWKK